MKIQSLETSIGNTFIPVQQEQIARNLLRSADCYQQRFIKFDGVGIYHSYAEYIHAAILESDISISAFVPQPYKLMIGRRRYVPDCYFVKHGKRYVVEIKPRGAFNSELKVPLTKFFERKGISFETISNESILENEVLGLNWIQITQTLLSSRFEDTGYQEQEIWENLHAGKSLSVGDIVNAGHRIGCRLNEIALFRLAHSGRIHLSLSETEINYDTEVSLCS